MKPSFIAYFMTHALSLLAMLTIAFTNATYAAGVAADIYASAGTDAYASAGTDAYASAGTDAYASAGTEQFPTDKNDWTGDKIQFLSNVIDIYGGNGGSQKYFAPRGASLKVTKDDLNTHKLIVQFVNVTPGTSPYTTSVNTTTGLPFATRLAAWTNLTDVPDDDPMSFNNTQVEKSVPHGYKSVDNDNVYLMYKGAVETLPHRRSGWSLGGLILPIKYNAFSTKKVTSNTTVGPWVGYSFGGNGGTFTPIATAGYVLDMKVQLAAGGTENRSAFSYGVGIVYTINKGDKTQIGIVLGRDRIGAGPATSENYNRSWLSFTIGGKII